MKMVMISADDYEKLSNAKKESETKIESYKQCIAGYESRIKELTEERDKLKDQYRSAVAKRVLNSAYGVEQDICCRISKNLNASMFDKISQLSDENEKLKKESAEKSEWLKAKNEALDNLIIAHNKLEKEYKELKDCKDMYENKLKNTEVTLKSVAIDKYVNDSFIKTLRSQAEEDANKMKELRQKYEAVLKANEKLATENSRLANDENAIKLTNELIYFRKTALDNANAFKSMRRYYDELCKQLLRADIDGDVITLPHNGKRIIINHSFSKNPEVTKLNNELTDLKNMLNVKRVQYNCLHTDYERAKLARIEAINEKERLENLITQFAADIKTIYEKQKDVSYPLTNLYSDLKKYL